MRIGINALYMIPGGVGGTEIYLRSLLDAMIRVAPENEHLVFINEETEAEPLPGTVIPMKLRASNRPARILTEQLRLPFAARGCDVLFNPGFTAPLIAPCPMVTVFHDLQHKQHPENFRWWDLPAWRLLLWQAARFSTRLIAVSEATRLDLIRCYGVDATVVHHGVDSRLFEINRQPEKMLLCVSTLHPHKNLERLARVFRRFRENHPDWKLVLAGMRGFQTQAIEAAAGEGVSITGWLPRGDLYDLYRRAGAFVYPSTFEGFGMPVVEALAAGVPVACSNIAPLREIADGAAVFFDPGSDDAMLDALELVLTQPAQQESARPFTWERSARRTLDVLATAAGLRVAPSRPFVRPGT